MSDLRVSVDAIDHAWMLEHSVAIAPGVLLPAEYTARAVIPVEVRRDVYGETLLYSENLETVVKIRAEVIGPHAAEVTVTSEGPWGVTSEGIRKVPVARIVSEATRQVVWVRDGNGRAIIGPNLAKIPRAVVDQWPDGDVVTFLRYAAITYKVADAIGDGPTAAVAEAAGVSRATAGRIVDAARKRGLLRPVLKRDGTSRKLTRREWDEQLGQVSDGDPDEPIEVHVIGVPSNYREVTEWVDPQIMQSRAPEGTRDGEHPEEA